jgi:hypothetical protein
LGANEVSSPSIGIGGRSKEGSEAFEKAASRVAAGALDVLDKPLGNELDDAWEEKLVSTVKLIARIKVITHPRARLGPMGRSPGGRASSTSAAPRGTTLGVSVSQRQALQGEATMKPRVLIVDDTHHEYQTGEHHRRNGWYSAATEP